MLHDLSSVLTTLRLGLPQSMGEHPAVPRTVCEPICDRGSVVAQDEMAASAVLNTAERGLTPTQRLLDYRQQLITLKRLFHIRVCASL